MIVLWNLGFLAFLILFLSSSWACKLQNARKGLSKKFAVKAGVAVSSAILQVATLESRPVFAALHEITLSPSSSSTMLVSRNLPEDTGATRSNQGQASSLIPIIKMQSALEKSLIAANQENIQEVKTNLNFIPSKEKEFKRIFDEYSQGISYKQEYLDKNAFLV